MNKDFWERINKLEELAGKATQGEWYPEYPQGYDIEIIAAANPAMIKKMIAELRSLEKEADWLAEKCACQNIKNGCQCGIDKNYRRNEARKAVAGENDA